MSLDWKTLAFELLNFVVLMLILGRFLFRPVRKVMAERKAEIEAKQREVAAALESAEASRRGFEARKGELEAGAEALAADARARAEKSAEAIVGEARHEAQRIVDAANAEVEALHRRALADLRPALVRLAGEAAARLLAEPGLPGLAPVFAGRAAAALLASLPARPLPPIRAWISADADMDAVVGVLRRELGAAATIDAVRDESMVGGVRLSAAGVEVEASASASLAAWSTDHDLGDVAGEGER